MTSSHRLRSLFRVVLPVAIASVLVFLAFVNMALVKAWHGEPEDGVLWRQAGANIVAAEVSADGAGARAGIQIGDTLVTANGRELSTKAEIDALLHSTPPGQPVRYVLV